jgi:dCMP deaminase
VVVKNKILSKEGKMEDNRPTWDEYFMLIAQTTATRSSCLRAKVGAVLVVEKQIVATGYNGAPAGTPNCLEVGCKVIGGHCLRTVHAEANALIHAAKRGISTRGAVIYCTHKPCLYCVKLLINAGIAEIVYRENYRANDEESRFADELLAQAGVAVRRLELG